METGAKKNLTRGEWVGDERVLKVGEDQGPAVWEQSTLMQ